MKSRTVTDNTRARALTRKFRHLQVTRAPAIDLSNKNPVQGSIARCSKEDLLVTHTIRASSCSGSGSVMEAAAPLQERWKKTVEKADSVKGK